MIGTFIEHVRVSLGSGAVLRGNAGRGLPCPRAYKQGTGSDSACWCHQLNTAPIPYLG